MNTLLFVIITFCQPYYQYGGMNIYKNCVARITECSVNYGGYIMENKLNQCIIKEAK